MPALLCQEGRGGGSGGGVEEGGGEDERGQEEVRENWEEGRYSVGSVNTLHAVRAEIPPPQRHAPLKWRSTHNNNCY